MEDYTKIVDENKSRGTKKEKELIWYHHDVMEIVSGGQIETLPIMEETSFQRLTLGGQKLDEYLLGTSRSWSETIDEYNTKISGIINSIQGFLHDLKDCLSDIAEVETIFSNIIQNHKRLWELRKYRERAYAEVLVLVESCIRYYDVGELNLDKVNILDEVYTRLRTKNVLNSYPKECRKKLQQVGFDIFRPFYIAADKYVVIEKKKIVTK